MIAKIHGMPLKSDCISYFSFEKEKRTVYHEFKRDIFVLFFFVAGQSFKRLL